MIGNAIRIDGWMAPDELSFLAFIAKKCATIIEVGCYKGRSTRALADNCDGIVYAVDPWNGELKDSVGKHQDTVSNNTLEEFIKNLYDNPTKSIVIVSRGTFEEKHPNLPMADFIFIDGDHSYESVKKDIQLALEHLKPRGIIAGHDYRECWPGVIKAVDEILGTTTIINTIWASGNL